MNRKRAGFARVLILKTPKMGLLDLQDEILKSPRCPKEYSHENALADFVQAFGLKGEWVACDFGGSVPCISLTFEL